MLLTATPLTQLLKNAVAIPSRQSDIEQHQVGALRGQAEQTCLMPAHGGLRYDVKLGLGARTKMLCQLICQRASAAPSRLKIKSRNAKARSAVATLTLGLSDGPPVSDRSVNMLWEPP